jgi:hypothetical protein
LGRLKEKAIVQSDRFFFALVDVNEKFWSFFMFDNENKPALFREMTSDWSLYARYAVGDTTLLSEDLMGYCRDRGLTHGAAEHLTREILGAVNFVESVWCASPALKSMLLQGDLAGAQRALLQSAELEAVFSDEVLEGIAYKLALHVAEQRRDAPFMQALLPLWLTWLLVLLALIAIAAK